MSPSSAAIAFQPAGHPLHTRSLALDAFQEDAQRLRVEGTILDLRKCGFVPTGGEVQSAGFIHHMHWRCAIDAGGRIERLEIAQPIVAMERSPATGGECCRDPAPRLQAIVGSAFDDGFGKRLAGVFGGPLGCSHLLTLGQALGAFVPRVLANPGRAPEARAAGERVAKQSLVIDGFERPEGGLAIAIQASEYDLAPRARTEDFLARAAHVREARVLGEVALADLRLAAISAAVRERTPATLSDAAWRDLDAVVAPLAGGPALRGMAARIRARLDGLPASHIHALLAEALLNFAPALIQCMPALTHRMPAMYASRAANAPAARPAAMSGGLTDSCYMWRTGSPANGSRIA
jgi:hypothetical protein